MTTTQAPPYSLNATRTGVRRDAEQRDRLIAQVYALAERYQPVTLRQSFYLLVNAGWLAKTEREYKNLGTLVTKMRRRGPLPWAWVIDAGRYNRTIAQWASPSDALRQLANQYRRRVWDDQAARVYIGTEKEALAGVMQPICDEYGVTLIVSRGYPSATYLHDLHAEFESLWRFDVHFFYYGDHDPSGDGIADLFEHGSAGDDGVPGLPVEFHRSALTAEQIIDNDYLTRPPKATDSRTLHWRHGGAEAADVDTIPPDELRTMVRADIESVIDRDAFDETLAQQREDIERLEELAEEWEA